MNRPKSDIVHKVKYEGWNSIIFRMVGAKMKVLDVGCGGGLLGKALLREIIHLWS